MQIEKCKMKINNRGLWSLVLGLRPLVLNLRSWGFDIRSGARFSPFLITTKEQRPKNLRQWGAFTPLSDLKRSCPNLHFSIFIFHFSFLLLCLLFALCAGAQAQVMPDKMVASVTNGSRATPDLITYSDLVWQLALEPDTPSSERPSSAQLNRALRLVEDQLLILQEARKLPSADTTDANAARDKQVDDKVNELARLFGSQTALQQRMTRVGLTTEQLHLILRDRVMVEQYLDFRFRAFAVVTDREIQDRYNQRYGRLRNSGQIVPTLEQVSPQIERDLREEKIETEIDKFVDELREQPGTEIVILNPV
jgi:hypothetical protein